MSWRLVASSWMESGVILPSSECATRSFDPLEKNSGAPHSSVSTCEVSAQITPWYAWQSEASASEFAAVPLKTKKMSQSVSNNARKALDARSVHGSSPYEGAKPRLASSMADQASGQMPA